MKKFGLLLLVLLIFVGCGNSSDSRPSQDGKGDIDVVKYLPSQDMVKHFSYGEGLVYAGMGTREIKVLANTVKILQKAKTTSPFMSDEVIKRKSIIYNDMNITGFYEDSYQDIYTTLRYVDKNEILVEDKRESISKYYAVEVGEYVGTEKSVYSTKCFYVGTTDKVLNSSQEVIKESGDYLLVECNELEEDTYIIDKEYKDIINIDSKSIKTKRFKYYEKGIGYISEYTADYNYLVTSIDY